MFLWLLFLGCFVGIAGLASALFSLSAKTAVPEPVSLGSLGVTLVASAWIIKFLKSGRKN